MPASEWPSPEAEQELLAKLLASDPAASADFMVAYYPPLMAHVRIANRGLDDAIHHDAAMEAVVSLVKNPHSYKPERGSSLASYLKGSASGDLKNILRKERKHLLGRKPIDVVEPAAEAGNELDLIDEARHAAATVLPAVEQGLSPEELGGLKLILEGERSTAAFAAALKLPAEDAEAAVKAFKDKIKKRIQRASRGAP